VCKIWFDQINRLIDWLVLVYLFILTALDIIFYKFKNGTNKREKKTVFHNRILNVGIVESNAGKN